jgi:chromosome partitioning protein
VLIGSKSINEIILKTKIPTLDLIPSNIGLVSIEKELEKIEDKEFILKKKLKELDRDYDYVIIDTPSTLGLITINVLIASDSVIIPVQTEYFSLEGLEQFLDTIKLIKKTKNPKLDIKGILPTMYTKANNLSKQVLHDIIKHFREKMFKSGDKIIVIPRNIRLAEAPSFGMPVISYDIKSPGAMAYLLLANKILDYYK